MTKTAIYLADKYADYYSNMRPPLPKSLVVAGAMWVARSRRASGWVLASAVVVSLGAFPALTGHAAGEDGGWRWRLSRGFPYRMALVGARLES